MSPHCIPPSAPADNRFHHQIYADLMAALPPLAAHPTLRLPAAVPVDAGLRVATLENGLAAYASLGLTDDNAARYGLPGPSELQGRQAQRRDPWRLLGWEDDQTVFFPYQDADRRVVDLRCHTITRPSARPMGLRRSAAQRQRLPFGLWDTPTLTQAQHLVLCRGEWAQLAWAHVGQAALSVRNERDWDQMLPAAAPGQSGAAGLEQRTGGAPANPALGHAPAQAGLGAADSRSGVVRRLLHGAPPPAAGPCRQRMPGWTWTPGGNGCGPARPM